MLEARTFDIRNMKLKDAEVSYFGVPESEEYRIEFIKELIEVKNNEMEVVGFDIQELDNILSYLWVIPCQLTHFFGLRQESAK